VCYATLKTTRCKQCVTVVLYRIYATCVSYLQLLSSTFSWTLMPGCVFQKNGLDSEIAWYYLLMTIQHSVNNSYDSMKMNFALTMNLYANCFICTLLIAPCNSYRLSSVCDRTPKVYIQVKCVSFVSVVKRIKLNCGSRMPMFVK
jgi:hypothetical protein